jgi:hypothetical protein
MTGSTRRRQTVDEVQEAFNLCGVCAVHYVYVAGTHQEKIYANFEI